MIQRARAEQRRDGHRVDGRRDARAPSDAARISATPQASDTKNAYSCETPRSRGLSGPDGTMFIPRRYRSRKPSRAGRVAATCAASRIVPLGRRVAAVRGWRGGVAASFARARSGVTLTTSQASPTRARPRISQPEGSSSYQRRPWKADCGKAWWLWCQASPSDGSASQKTFVDSSSVVEAPAAEEVADRVDAPGDVVHEEDPHEPRPQQRAQAAGDERAAAEREAEQERQQRGCRARSAGSSC